jgi:hypothetical protein
MVLLTKNRTLVDLVKRAYERALAEGDQVLVVWNARVYLQDSLVVMESACPIFLDKIVEQLRIFVGSKEARPGRLLWVRAGGNRARRWALAKPRALAEPAPSLRGGSAR